MQDANEFDSQKLAAINSEQNESAIIPINDSNNFELEQFKDKPLGHVLEVVMEDMRRPLTVIAIYKGGPILAVSYGAGGVATHSFWQTALMENNTRLCQKRKNGT